MAAALPAGRPPHRLILVGGSVLAFAPQTLREQDGDLLADLPALRVLGAPLDQVFLMKLHATRVRTSDVEDMVVLWPRTGFASAAQAVARYYEAYPLAEEDPFLAAHIADLTGAPHMPSPRPIDRQRPSSTGSV